MVRKAFTLPEVLITLGIISVIAILTLSNLIQNYKEHVYINRLNGVYNQLSEATQRMIQEEGTIDTWGSDSSERMTKYKELLSKYMNVVSICPKAKRGCIGYRFIERYNNTKFTAGVTGGQETYLLKNGIGLRIDNGANDYCTQDVTLSVLPYPDRPNVHYGTYGMSCGSILVDLTGPSGPNNSDVDMFSFKIVKNGIVPAGSAKESSYTNTFESRCISGDGGDGKCASWVIYNKNMDYLHCPEKLGWQKAKSCKE